MKGWLNVAAVVVAYDAWAIRTQRATLSRQFHEATTAHPALVAAGSVYLLAHLWGAWPRKADPFNLFALAVRSL